MELIKVVVLVILLAVALVVFPSFVGALVVNTIAPSNMIWACIAATTMSWVMGIVITRGKY